MARFKITISGYEDVATCNSLASVKKALSDRGLLKMDVWDSLAMAESLFANGKWSCPCQDDRRLTFLVEIE